MQKKHTGGFSLIELLIVMTILSIIAAIGYPAYTNYVIRGKRSEARAALLDIAARQERFYSDNNQYVTLQGGNIDSSTENGNYNISINLMNSNQDFTLRASPTFADNECGYFEITKTGAKTSQNGTAATCWGR